jgi:hypothetical protein
MAMSPILSARQWDSRLLERSQWDSEEVEPAADAQLNDHMIDGLIDLSPSAVSLLNLSERYIDAQYKLQ